MFVQQYPQGSGCYACYRKADGDPNRKREWSHDHRTCEVCQSFVKAKMEKGDYLLCHVARFKFDYYYVPEEETARNVGAAAALDDARAFAAGAGLMQPGSVRRGALTGSMRNGARSWSIKERAATIVAT